jgi:hypothetical protein
MHVRKSVPFNVSCVNMQYVVSVQMTGFASISLFQEEEEENPERTFVCMCC